MTTLKKLTLITATSSLVITLFGAMHTAEAAKSVFQRAKPQALTTSTQGQSAGGNSTFCGNGDTIVIYDEDKNGNPVPGTKVYGCTD